MISKKILILTAIFASACGLADSSALAADKVRAIKAVDIAWSFIPLDVGAEEGFFTKYGIDIEISASTGDAKLQQALASNSVDFGLGSGPGMAFAVKGSPVVAVAAFAAEPRNISVVVAADSPVKSVADLKGKLLAVTTAGSLTDWLAKRLAVQEGWGTDGVRTIALGSFESFMAALRTKQIDGMMLATEAGYLLEERKEGRVVVGMEKYAPKFHTHVVYARKDIVAQNPDLVARFLKGFFASIIFMKNNKEKTTEIATRILHQSPAVMGRTWDYEISMLETDGHFDPEALAVLKDSFIGMGILQEKPADDQILTTRFLPVKP
jgi:NitT/TauT family transport system substrate-binding protein